MRKYDRYRGENLLINGLWGVLFGTFPIIAILIYLAVAKTIEGFSVAPNVLVILNYIPIINIQLAFEEYVSRQLFIF